MRFLNASLAQAIFLIALGTIVVTTVSALRNGLRGDNVRIASRR